MDQLRRQAEQIFQEIVSLSDDERQKSLRDNCDNVEVRSEVERLLESDRTQGGGLMDDATDVQATRGATSVDVHLGDRIGPYKLLQQIGEGGMGSA